MFAVTVSTRSASRASPTLMNALNHSQAMPTHNASTQPVGLGLNFTTPPGASASTIDVEPPTPPVQDTRPAFMRNSSSRRGTNNRAFIPPAAPTLQCTTTMPPMLFSPGPKAPTMLHPPVMPWVFTPPASSSTPATAGHNNHEQEGYFPSTPAQSTVQVPTQNTSAKQPVRSLL